jgi:hypothetical protein
MPGVDAQHRGSIMWLTLMPYVSVGMVAGYVADRHLWAGKYAGAVSQIVISILHHGGIM